MLYRLPLAPRPSGCAVPLTAFQKAHWRAIAELNSHKSPFRNVAASLRLSGDLDVHRLEQSIGTVTGRHESLRSRIAHFDLQKSPTQVVDPPRSFKLPLIDISGSENSEREQAARKLGAEFLSETIDLREKPAFDATLLRLSPRDHVLLLMLDHILSDGASYPVLTGEIMSLLRAGTSQADAALPDLGIQFPDYAVWHDRTVAAWRRDHEPYWRSKLSGISKLCVPSDSPSSDETSQTSSVIHVPLGKQLTDELRNVARQQCCLMPLIVLSLYLVLLHYWCERTDLPVAFISNGRHGCPEFRNMIGCIAHPVFLRVEITSSTSLRDLVAQVTSELRSSFAHDPSHLLLTDITSDDVTEIFFNWLPADWGLSGTYLSESQRTDDSDHGLRITRFPIGRELVARFAPYFSDSPSGILVVLWYDGNLFLRSTVERFGSQLRRITRLFVRNPATLVGEFDARI